MRIFLVRHGHYDAEGEAAGSLNSLGRAEIMKAAQALREAGIRFTALFMISSPKLRTRQTSDILNAVLGSESYGVTPRLDDGSDAEEAYRWLVETVNGLKGSLVMVSHMVPIGPLLDKFSESFGQPKPSENPDYGSVHMVDLLERTVTKLT